MISFPGAKSFRTSYIDYSSSIDMSLIVNRIKDVYLTRLDLLKTNYENIFNLKPIKDPIYFACGCANPPAYEREDISKWLSQKDHVLPLCRHPGECILMTLNSKQEEEVLQIKEEREEWEEDQERKEIIKYEKLDYQKANCYQTLAQYAKEHKEYKTALKSFYEAAKLVKDSSFIYQDIVSIYEEKGNSERAKCARIYLSILQVQENKLSSAKKTLQKCDIKEIAVPLLLLKILTNETPFDEILEEAKKLPNEEHLIYQWMIAKKPNYYPAYLALGERLKNVNEKKRLYLEGEKIAEGEKLFAWAAEFTKLYSLLPNRYSIAVEEWGDVNAVKERIPWPPELVAFWSSLRDSQKEEYVVFPIPSQLIFNGEKKPCTYSNIAKIAKAKNPDTPGIIFLGKYAEDKEIIPPQDVEITWAVVKKYPIPGTHLEIYKNQLNIMNTWRANVIEVTHNEGFKNFDAPCAHDMLFAILWHWQASSGRELLYSKYLTRCQESVRDEHLIIGDNCGSGINIRVGTWAPRDRIRLGVIAKFPNRVYSTAVTPDSKMSCIIA